eukprot:EG_transcript_37618
MALVPVIPLPRKLKGYVKYIVAVDPHDRQAYSVGIKHVLPTSGAHKVLAQLQSQRYRHYRKCVTSVFCPFSPSPQLCPHGTDCDGIHITAEGYLTRRPWQRPQDRAATAAERPSEAAEGDPPFAAVACTPFPTPNDLLFHFSQRYSAAAPPDPLP